MIVIDDGDRDDRHYDAEANIDDDDLMKVILRMVEAGVSNGSHLFTIDVEQIILYSFITDRLMIYIHKFILIMID